MVVSNVFRTNQQCVGQILADARFLSTCPIVAPRLLFSGNDTSRPSAVMTHI